MKTGKSSGFLARLPRFSDKRQSRAAGNIAKFLAALFALTMIARGTSGATLARVELSNPSRAEIIDAVTGSADVSVVDTIDISAPEGLTIAEMLAVVGQSVMTGDAVAIFDIDEIQERLTREIAKLDKLLFDLSNLERDVQVDASALETARRSLRRAQEDYNTIRAQGEADVAAALDAYETAMEKIGDDPDSTALETARRNLRRAQEDYITTRVQGTADVASARDAHNAARDRQPESPDRTAIDNARRTLDRARDDYDILDPEAPYETRLAALRRIEDAQAALTRAEQDYSRSQQQAAEAVQSEIDRTLTALETAENRARSDLIGAERRIEDAQIAFDKAEQDYGNNIDRVADDLLNEIDRAYAAIETAENRALDNLLGAERRVEDARASLEKANQDYGRSEQQASDAEEQNSISAVTLRLDIDVQKAVVDRLDELYNNDGALYSPLAGVVSATMSEGGITGASPLVSFLDGAKGFEAVMTVGRSDAEKLAVGDECQVTTGGGSMYYTPTVTGVVSGISTPDQNDRVVITIRLPDGDWTRGQRVEVQAIMSRDTYNLCVPLTALRSDNSGYYLLTVEQTVTVLGVVNIVVRAPVTVSASDGDMAAVSGTIGRDSDVITGSSKAVQAGDRVRVN